MGADPISAASGATPSSHQGARGLGSSKCHPQLEQGSHSSFPLSLGGVIKLIINHYMPLRLTGDEGSPHVVQVLSLPGDLRPGWFLFFLALCDTK